MAIYLYCKMDNPAKAAEKNNPCGFSAVKTA